MQNGVAFHHAGLNSSDRVLVEESFLKGIVGVLVTTTTLASGVNLPAYLVVIRGTTMYSGGSVSEYSSSQILQMIGRAGRIQVKSDPRTTKNPLLRICVNDRDQEGKTDEIACRYQRRLYIPV